MSLLLLEPALEWLRGKAEKETSEIYLRQDFQLKAQHLSSRSLLPILRLPKLLNLKKMTAPLQQQSPEWKIFQVSKTPFVFLHRSFSNEGTNMFLLLLQGPILHFVPRKWENQIPSMLILRQDYANSFKSASWFSSMMPPCSKPTFARCFMPPCISTTRHLNG